MLSENTRGAALMAGAMSAYTLNDACMKALAGSVPMEQALLLRGIGTTLALFAVTFAMGGLRAPISRRDWGLIALRSVAEVAAAWFFVTALFHMPLANVSAILQALPLSVTLCGALIFGEAVGWRRLSAIAVGFFGVLLIVRPGTEGFTVYSVYALGAVASVTVRDLSARRMSAAVPSLTVALAASVAVTGFFGVGSLFVTWVPLDGTALLQILAATGFVVAGYVASVSAMRAGEIGFVAPFRYTSLIVALVLGLVVFGDWPEAPTLVGAALVVGTGLFTLYRERRTARRNLRAAAAGLRLR